MTSAFALSHAVSRKPVRAGVGMRALATMGMTLQGVVVAPPLRSPDPGRP